MVNIQNGIITMNRGDTFYMPLRINIGTKIHPIYYEITNDDEIYFAVEEYNQPFEFALIRKKITKEDLIDGEIIVQLSCDDTEFLLPGEYYYEVKLRHITKKLGEEDEEFVDTIVPRRKFIILE